MPAERPFPRALCKMQVKLSNCMLLAYLLCNLKVKLSNCMIKRDLENPLKQAMDNVGVVALLGPRQVGKTTLALELTANWSKKTTYLDLELDSDLSRLDDPEAYLRRFENQLLIIDEVQRKPDLF